MDALWLILTRDMTFNVIVTAFDAVLNILRWWYLRELRCISQAVSIFVLAHMDCIMYWADYIPLVGLNAIARSWSGVYDVRAAGGCRRLIGWSATHDILLTECVLCTQVGLRWTGNAVQLVARLACSFQTTLPACVVPVHLWPSVIVSHRSVGEQRHRVAWWQLAIFTFWTVASRCLRVCKSQHDSYEL